LNDEKKLNIQQDGARLYVDSIICSLIFWLCLRFCATMPF
jgi:hypothetical protein